MTSRYGRNFLADDAGAVTVDWVALVSGTLLLGTMTVYAVFNQGVASLVGEINDTLGSATLGVSVGPAPDLNAAAPATATAPGSPGQREDDDGHN